MTLITVAGPPSSGKTSVIIKACLELLKQNKKVGVIKFDCLSSQDGPHYEQQNIPVKVGLSGNLCPDHFFITNLQECWDWGMNQNFDLLITESAGLCNRCAPHVKGFPAVCILDNLSGIDTPKKIGPMLKTADQVLITKGDIVSQAEREVFAFRVRQANPKAQVLFVNGISGQGVSQVTPFWVHALQQESTVSVVGGRLRFPVPAAVCSYCLGETKIGQEYQRGNVKKMVWETPA